MRSYGLTPGGRECLGFEDVEAYGGARGLETDDDEEYRGGEMADCPDKVVEVLTVGPRVISIV